MSTRKGTMRRGPTLRGRSGYPPQIGPRPGRRTAQNDDEEEFVALNSTRDDDLEMEQMEFNDEHKSSGGGQPMYHHGEETFGDVISHPIEEFHAHRERRKTFKAELGAWNTLPPEEKLKMQTGESGESGHHEHYILVLHFRQLRGNQSFALDHDRAEEFALLLRLSQNERIRFNGVHDTDSLTAFLYKIKREFSIKIHHQKTDHGDHHHHQDLEHNLNNRTMDFNDNLYIEFNPHTNQEDEFLSAEETRRPFFQHPEPDLSADIGEEKAASWLELFYDLFYVATLTEFTHSHVIKDWSSLGTYAQWFIITWWAWCASTLYTARFNTDDVVHHIWKLIEMCSVISMAGTAQHFLTSPAYVYGYIALKTVLAIEYSIVLVVALLAGSKSRVALAFYICGNLISIAFWGASLVILEQSIHRTLWFLGILTEVLVNVISRSDRTLSWAASNLAERLGLLTLIVLGENLIGLIGLVAKSGLSMLIMAPNWMAVIIIFGFFFMYFEDFTKEVFLHSRHHQIWVYLHFPLHLCQVAFGIALINTLKVYRAQLIEEGKLSEENEDEAHASKSGSNHETASGSSNHETASGSSSEKHGSEAASSSSSASESSQSDAAPAEGHTTSAHKLARRALESVGLSKDDYYTYTPLTTPSSPMRIQQQQQPWYEKGYLTLATSALSTVAYSAIQMVSSDQAIDANNHTQHSLARRAGGEELKVDFSESEKVFIYKTFLIMGGVILVLNSLIKLVNTKITDIYGKVIIGSRVLNALVLWSMCALPFSQLQAIVLLSVMMGSLILQTIVDLLD